MTISSTSASATTETETGTGADAVARYRVGVLGPLRVVVDGVDVDLGGPKQRLVLALLLSGVDRVVSSGRLIEGLWGEEPPATARKAVQVHVSNLRRVLGDGFPLLTAPGGYVIQSGEVDFDAVLFEAAVGSAKAKLRTDPLSAERVMAEALSLWSGPPYSDIDDEPALLPEIARLNELRLQALEGRLDAALRAGRHADAVGELATLVAEHPYRERFGELHMLALYRSGRQAEALRAYQRIRTTLVEELGVDPGPGLQAMHQQILEQSPDLDLGDAGGDRFSFLATDIEASTALWEADPEAMQRAVARHDEILTGAVESNSGRVFKGTGDGVFAVFASATDALQAAVDAQQGLHAEPWPGGQPLLVRMGVDEGTASQRDGDYFGPALNRVSRIMSSGHGGQVLCPAALAAQAPVATRDLGGADYKGVGRIDVAQLVVPGLDTDFPDLETDRAPKPMVREGFGRAIRGYELRERLGQGAHGVVYRAYQAAIGREVAIKVIRPEHANQPDFVKRFEAEAQFVAQLEHPHIVSLYDYWRDPDGAYLVMQVLRGGSLSASLERAPWRPPAALKLLDQIGAALDYAHRQGVMHRDLKPANVLLDGEGNAFLSDFGIASQHLEAVGVPDGSSVAYVSPEELAGDPAGLASDMYGLGLLTYEILTGDRPALGDQPAAVGDRRQDLPPSLDQVLARATDPDPTKRFGRVDDFLRALRQTFGADVVNHERREVPVDVRNPYKGLRAFSETDANDFFGRDDLVRDLLDHVTANRITAVVGPSGSGKSSLVRAGLLPQMRRRSTAGKGTVLITDMFPGSYPFEELEAALLRVAVDRSDGILGDLIADDRGLLRISKQILPDDDSELLLVIDQFEELFLLTPDDEARRNFLSSLVTVAGDERSRVRIVVTIRADHFDRPLSDPEFGAIIRDKVVPISVPTHDELAQAIAQPAAGAGLEFEPGLIPRIVRDVAAEPGALPLMQYALTELVGAREGVELTTAGYTERGGVTGSLARRAEEIHEGLSDTARNAAREVFLRLVAVDEEGDDTRRRVRRAELESLGLGEASLDAVLDGFGAFRLLSFDRDPITRGPTVEVAHEALIREWPRFRTWVDERREDLLLERRLAASTTEWDEGGRDPSFLFAGGQLEQYEKWAGTADVRLTTEEREFLERSRGADDEERRQKRRRRSLVVSALSVLAVLALVAAGLALQQRNDANDEAASADAARAEAEAAAVAEGAARADAEAAAVAEGAARADAEAAALAERDALADAVVKQRIAESARLADQEPSLSMLIAREVYERAPGPDTLGALLTSLQHTDGFLGHIATPESSSNNQWIGLIDDETIVVRTATSIDVYDLSTRSLVSTSPSQAFLSGTITTGSVGGGRFATIDNAGTVRIIEPGETEPRPPLDLLPAETGSTLSGAGAVSVGDDGTLVVGGLGGRVVVISPDSRLRATLTGHQHLVLGTALSPDGRMAATQDQWGNITLWDVDLAEPIWSWIPVDSDRWKPGSEPIEIAKGDDGSVLEIGLVDGGPQRLPLDSIPPGLPGVAGELRFSSDGSTLYSLVSGLIAFDVVTGELRWQRPWSGSQFQLAEIGNGQLILGNEIIEDGELVARLEGLGSSARVAVSADGATRVASESNGISIWSTTGDQLLAAGLPIAGSEIATLSPDGTQVAAFDLDNPSTRGSPAIRDIQTGSVVSWPGDPTWVLFTTTGEIFEYSPLRDLSFRDPDDGEELGTTLERQTWGAVEVDPLRRFVAIGRLFENQIRIYDLETGELIQELQDPLPSATTTGEAGRVDLGSGVYWIDISPDGGLLAASNLYGVAIWETSSWSEVGTIDSPDGDEFTDIAFSPSGGELALVTELGAVAIHDIETTVTSSPVPGGVPVGGVNNVNSIEYGSDGSTIVTAGKGASIIDVATGDLIGAPFPSTALDSASISGDGMSVVTGTDEHLLVWDLDPTDWPDLACHAAGRNMTEDEWEQFGWPDEPYRPTCPEWDAGK